MESRFKKAWLGWAPDGYRADMFMRPRGNGSGGHLGRKVWVLGLESSRRDKYLVICRAIYTLPGCCPGLTGVIVAPAWL